MIRSVLLALPLLLFACAPRHAGTDELRRDGVSSRDLGGGEWLISVRVVDPQRLWRAYDVWHAHARQVTAPHGCSGYEVVRLRVEPDTDGVFRGRTGAPSAASTLRGRAKCVSPAPASGASRTALGPIPRP